MTINKYLQQISPEDLAYVKRYHHEIQPFRVLPSSTLEFDGQFNGGGETIFTEINLNEDHTIDDMFCVRRSAKSARPAKLSSGSA